MKLTTKKVRQEPGLPKKGDVQDNENDVEVAVTSEMKGFV